MSRLSNAAFAQEWLDGFDNPADRATASALINEILLVSGEMLVHELRRLVELILTERDDPERPIALYAERAVPKRDKVVLPFFPDTGAGRATGAGIPPIVIDPEDQEVGSEGLIANLITTLVRRHGGDVLSHPGPDRLRSDRARQIVIVTDFIGSGKRVWEMLEAFRAVATLRSWRSYDLLSFVVIAYAGTEDGLRVVRSSRLKPQILTVTGCPTLWNTFAGAQLSNVIALCRRFPRRHRHPSGFQNGGALIAFAHGLPNNAPPILWSERNGWSPLFPRRSTVGGSRAFHSGATEALAERASRLLRIRTAASLLDSSRGTRWVTTLMVLAALEAGSRTAQAASARTGLSLSRIEEILGYTQVAHWTSRHNALTRLGRQELARLRRRRRRAPVLPKTGAPFYYPTQLRAR